MPELPEVETVRQVLRKNILGQVIAGIDIYYEKMIHNISIEEFKKQLIGKKIIEIHRLGKYLYFELENDLFLISHLRMEGKYYLKDKNLPKEKHEHIIFYLDNNLTLRYDDTRKFGVMELRNRNDLYITHPLNALGPEAYEVSPEHLFQHLKKKIPVKTLLLDQSIVAGIGNIYADEICFLAGIHPLTLGCCLSYEDCLKISEMAKVVIEKAIQAGGTTIRSYTSSLGVTGRFQLELNVHTKAGEKCHRCNETILKMKVNGRGTYYCPNCQKQK